MAFVVSTCGTSYYIIVDLLIKVNHENCLFDLTLGIPISILNHGQYFGVHIMKKRKI